MEKVIIICGGDFDSSLLPENINEYTVIAADSGYAKAVGAGVTPHIAIGDWDSLGRVPEAPEVVTLSVRKDDTDLVAAARLALGRGCREMVILGALGGKRFSHSAAALQTLGWLCEMGIRAEIRDAGCTIHGLNAGKEIAFSEKESGTVSVLSLTEKTVVTLEGLWYEGENVELSSHFPLGVSNAFVGKASRIVCLEGTAVVIIEGAH